jgi:ribonuclease Z
MHLLGRTADLHIYCPKELKEIVDVQLKVSQTHLKYTIVYHFHQYIDNELIFEDDKVYVKSIVLNHRIPCSGFVFVEKPLLPHISKEVIEKHKIPVDQIHHIKHGSDYITSTGDIILNEDMVTPQHEPRIYSYCSDTVYDERIIDLVRGSTLLYHEATFLHELLQRATETYHTTCLQAATIASKANAKQLIIGHFSARYKDLQPLLEEAKSVFPNTILAVEGETVKI